LHNIVKSHLTVKVLIMQQIKHKIHKITLDESTFGHVSAIDRRLDTDNPFDLAITKVMFANNLLADGMTHEQAESMWKLTPWWTEGDQLFNIF